MKFAILTKYVATKNNVNFKGAEYFTIRGKEYTQLYDSRTPQQPISKYMAYMYGYKALSSAQKALARYSVWNQEESKEGYWNIDSSIIGINEDGEIVENIDKLVTYTQYSPKGYAVSEGQCTQSEALDKLQFAKEFGLQFLADNADKVLLYAEIQKDKNGSITSMVLMCCVIDKEAFKQYLDNSKRKGEPMYVINELS